LEKILSSPSVLNKSRILSPAFVICDEKTLPGAANLRCYKTVMLCRITFVLLFLENSVGIGATKANKLQFEN
jgi:hypothetical protein